MELVAASGAGPCSGARAGQRTGDVVVRRRAACRPGRPAAAPLGSRTRRAAAAGGAGGPHRRASRFPSPRASGRGAGVSARHRQLRPRPGPRCSRPAGCSSTWRATPPAGRSRSRSGRERSSWTISTGRSGTPRAAAGRRCRRRAKPAAAARAANDLADRGQPALGRRASGDALRDRPAGRPAGAPPGPRGGRCPLAWDGGRPWEFAFVVGPDDDDLPRRRSRPMTTTPRRPAGQGDALRGSRAGQSAEGSPRAAGDPQVGHRGLRRPDRPARGRRASRPGSTSSSAAGRSNCRPAHCDGLIERLAGWRTCPASCCPPGRAGGSSRARPGPSSCSTTRRRSPTSEPAAGGPASPQFSPACSSPAGSGSSTAASWSPPTIQAGGAADADRRVLVRRDRGGRTGGARAPCRSMASRPPRGMPRRRRRSRPSRGGGPRPARRLGVATGRRRLDGRGGRPPVSAGGQRGLERHQRHRLVRTLGRRSTSAGVSADFPALLEALARRPTGRWNWPTARWGFCPNRSPPSSPRSRPWPRSTTAGCAMAGSRSLCSTPCWPASRRPGSTRPSSGSGSSSPRGERPEAEDEPEGFRGTLRHYQREGLGWLMFLEGLGLGGCLADDMGLGKTIQVLALLLRRKALLTAGGLPHRPAWWWCPRAWSSTGSTRREKFAPELRVLNHTGNARAEHRRRPRPTTTS